MPLQRTKRSWREWLVFRKDGVTQATVRRHYEQWRREHGLPIRCDEPKCTFHTAPLIWNGKPFRPILDHVSGNRFDNRPKNLRFLCPLCDSQLSTRGGANKGRVADLADDKFTLVSKDGKRDYNLLIEPGKLVIEGHPPSLRVSGEATGEPHAQPGAAADAPKAAPR